MPALARIPALVIPALDPTEAAAPAPRAVHLQLVQPAPVQDGFESLRRPAAGLGASGVHPLAVVAVLSVFAALLLAFCAFFATPETGLTLFVIAVLGTVYFGLLGGGLLLADSPAHGEPRRDFAAFLAGRVRIATGWITGREAFVQMILLPLALLSGAIIFGLIWRVVSG